MGLRVQVYRHGTTDCTNGGISSKVDYLTVMNIDGPFEPREAAPAALLQNHIGKCLRIVPAELVGGEWLGKLVGAEWKESGMWHMAGGNYATTSDARFTAKCEELSKQTFYGAVAIHDRIE